MRPVLVIVEATDSATRQLIVGFTAVEMPFTRRVSD